LIERKVDVWKTGIQMTSGHGYFKEFEIGGVKTNVWGSVNIREAQIYIKKY